MDIIIDKRSFTVREHENGYEVEINGLIENNFVRRTYVFLTSKEVLDFLKEKLNG